jgi:hypothetical protein
MEHIIDLTFFPQISKISVMVSYLNDSYTSCLSSTLTSLSTVIILIKIIPRSSLRIIDNTISILNINKFVFEMY